MNIKDFAVYLGVCLSPERVIERDGESFKVYKDDSKNKGITMDLSKLDLNRLKISGIETAARVIENAFARAS